MSFDVKDAIYHICQEALWNILKHAQAKTVVVRLVLDEDFVVLQLNDDGIGFDTTESPPGHYGLRSMRDRAASLGGTVVIESSPGEGTTVRARIPSAAILCQPSYSATVVSDKLNQVC